MDVLCPLSVYWSYFELRMSAKHNSVSNKTIYKCKSLLERSKTCRWGCAKSAKISMCCNHWLWKLVLRFYSLPLHAFQTAFTPTYCRWSSGVIYWEKSWLHDCTRMTFMFACSNDWTTIHPHVKLFFLLSTFSSVNFRNKLSAL